VMVATSGDVLADADTIAAFERLMRIATVVTPNLPELGVLVPAVRPEPVEGHLSAREHRRKPCAGASTGSARTGVGDVLRRLERLHVDDETVLHVALH
ncbi:bifunctional hydroxymethylpyrimidine kinase/phosphomethylpyrimidine kinase, partial [Pseudomonas sp. GP01-A4]|uniref:bifunctional hydroxymethylpyrimidine kinase/phosphomethylpyrimidine kinase n=1 Tax=Pseudomonas sp. GP01-A4 TaxID=2070571 RepID=UPI000CAD9112